MTAGATEALAATLLALIDGPDDEVVVFEPYYDSYAAVVALAGARLVTVPLRWPDFQPDLDDLRSAVIGPHARHPRQRSAQSDRRGLHRARCRTRSIRLADRHDAIIVTDEVYEHLVFDGPHVPIATLPGAWERTLTISSGGKTFSTTGLEDRVGQRPGRSGRRRARGQAVPHLRQRRAVPARDRDRPAPAGRVLPRHRRRRCGRKRDLLGAGLRRGGLRRLGAGGLVLHRGGCRTPGRDGCRGVLPRAPRSGGRRRDPAHRVRRPRQRRSEYATLVRFAACKRVEVLEEAASRLAALAG